MNEKRSLNMKIPTALHARLSHYAGRERRALSNLAEIILEDWVVREDMKESRREAGPAYEIGSGRLP